MFNAIKVCIYVDDVERSVEFYTKKLGFEIAAQHPMGPKLKWTELAHQNGQVRIVPYPRAMAEHWQDHKPSVVFSCADVNAAYKEFQKRGVPCKGEPTKMGWGWFLHFSDPDGNEFGLSDAPLT